MNTTFSIRVNHELKKSFLSKTKERWLEWATLIRYFMEKFSTNPDIVKFDIDDNIFDDLLKDSSIASKLEKISDKLDSIWF